MVSLFSPVNLVTQFLPTTVALATANPIAAAIVGGITIYSTYKIGNKVVQTAKSVAPYALIPLANNYAIKTSIDEGEAGLLDFGASISKIGSKIPFVGKYFEIDLGPNPLHRVIDAEDGVEVAKVLINQDLVDVNTEHTSTHMRPLTNAIARNDAVGDEVALHIMQNGADLRMHAGESQQPLIHDVLDIGRQPLVEAAMSHHNALGLSDVDGNTIPHKLAVSSQFRSLDAVKNAEIPVGAYNQANNAGVYPLDMNVEANLYNDDALITDFIKHDALESRAPQDISRKLVIAGLQDEAFIFDV